MSSSGTESLIAARRRDTTRRRQRVLDALGQLAAAGQEISVSSVARKAGVDRSFLYRHHDLRAQVHVRSAAPAASPASTAASKQSRLADLADLADLANLREQNQRLRRQNTDLTARLPEVLGEEAFRASGIGRTDDIGALRTRVSQLEQQVLDLRQELEERTGDLDAARAANCGLISLANVKPSCAGGS
jgi:transposase-like protein